ncbi:hypothetical protein HO702_09350 [Streptococcus suis]|nr:hypothetical protein [Streptococcus suis]NQG80243.1 hypothetical protein [Streptococcus suis]NQL18120.1 hypothetical protein [Streptococcus suis]HEM4147768.1 hypothetical protein [Streptococcus suis]HEM6100240.1 hypothetical protein [Streptococcus suis]
MCYPEYQGPKVGIDTSFFALIVAGGAENFISGICFMLAETASKSIGRRSTARRQIASTTGNVH